MIHVLKQKWLDFCLKYIKWRSYFRPEKGAISVEYALCMFVASMVMVGITAMFNQMAIQVIQRFKDIVTTFPNI